MGKSRTEEAKFQRADILRKRSGKSDRKRITGGGGGGRRVPGKENSAEQSLSSVALKRRGIHTHLGKGALDSTKASSCDIAKA